MAAVSAEKLARLQLAARRELARRSFRWFATEAFPLIPPIAELLPSKAFDAITTALQAVADGRITRLGIECPPGVSKSVLGAVAFPAYLSLKTDGKESVMCGSYSQNFAMRDSERCRDLMMSDWYRELAGGRFGIKKDASRKSDFWTTTGGRRFTVSSGGRSMGERCRVQIIDDALASIDIHSPAKKARAVEWVSQMLPSRLADPLRDRRVMIGQRLVIDDPMAWVEEQGWKILRYPVVLEADDEPCELYDDHGELVWRDDREIGDAGYERHNAAARAQLEHELGPAAFAAQFKQRPHDDSSSMFKRAWFGRTWTELPERFDRMVIAMDSSFKAGPNNDYAVIQVWGALKADRYLVEQWRKQAGYLETKNALREIRERYPFAKILIEEASNGTGIIDELRREFPGIVPVLPKGGKMTRAATVEPICASGALVLPEHAPWRNKFIDEVTIFGPDAKHDDQVDAMVYALREMQIGNLAKLASRW